MSYFGHGPHTCCMSLALSTNINLAVRPFLTAHVQAGLWDKSWRAERRGRGALSPLYGAPHAVHQQVGRLPVNQAPVFFTAFPPNQCGASMQGGGTAAVLVHALQKVRSRQMTFGWDAIGIKNAATSFVAWEAHTASYLACCELNPLPQIPNSKLYATMRRCGALSDKGVRAIAALTRLHTLALDDCPKLEDGGIIAALRPLTSLTSLKVCRPCSPSISLKR